MIAVFAPVVAPASAAYVTTPVAVFKLYVPSPAIAITPSASHAAGEEAGVIKHVAAVSKPAVAVARPLAPVRVVNATEPPAATDLVCAVATGGFGAVTDGVIVAPPNKVVESAATYFTGEAVPTKVGNGSNVTVPFAFAVYVPSPATVNVDNVQLPFAVLVVAHNLTDDAVIVSDALGVSFVRTVMTWLVSYAPLDVSSARTGPPLRMRGV